jgi:hypothetical protein
MLLASNYDQTRFFKAADMPQEKKLRIKDVTEEEIGVGKDKEKKLCVWFTNDARGLVLNKTNNRMLRGAFGNACDGWKGKIIVVFPTQDDFGGRMVPALRVRIPPPKQSGDGQNTKPATPLIPTPAAAADPTEIDVDEELNDDF